MSTATGTATDYLDLLAKLRTFLKTDATLVGLGQNWTELATVAVPFNHTDSGQVNIVDYETYLQAPGLSGTEQIFINLQAYHNVAADIYNFRIKGAVGYSAAVGATFFNQPGGSPDAYVCLWNQSIPYWFFANGQRVVVVAKVSTTYEMFYAGKFLPYGTPGQYPYPLAIGGTSGNASSTDPLSVAGFPANANIRFSNNTSNHAAFFDPFALYWIDSALTWHSITHYQSTSHQNASESTLFPWFYADNTPLTWLETNLDGSYPVFLARLSSFTPINDLGELDGVGFTTGFATSSESTITDQNAAVWTVFQDTFRTASNDYCVILNA